MSLPAWQRGLSHQAPDTVTSLHQSYAGTHLQEVTNTITGSPSTLPFPGALSTLPGSVNLLS